MARVAFESSGTQLHKGKLLIRLDLYSKKGEKAYESYCVYNNEIGIWVINPHLCLFLQIDGNVTEALLKEWIDDVLTPDTLATIDESIVHPGSAHLISPYMRGKKRVSSGKVSRLDDKDKAEIEDRFNNVDVSVKKGNRPEFITPHSIVIGPGAADRTSAGGSSAYTSVDNNVPASDTGSLDTLELWYNSNATVVKVGTFSGSGTSWTNRDYHTIGAVASGSKHTTSSVDVDVVSGDYLGVYQLTGAPERTWTGSSYQAGLDRMGAGTQTYDAIAMTQSMYATGSSATNYPITITCGITANSDVDRTIAWERELYDH